MFERHLQPLPTDLASLLAQATPVTPVAAVRARVRARLPAIAVPPQLAPVARAPGSSGALGRLLAAKLPLSMAFAVGAAMGGAGGAIVMARHDASERRPEARSPAIVAPPHAPATSALATSAPFPAESALSPPSPEPSAAQAPRIQPVRRAGHPTSSTDAALQAERTVVERGRVALTRGDAAGALRAAEEHRARFPRGQLREEREALRVRALAALGRRDEAAAALARFREAFPESLLLPALSHDLP